MVESRSHHARRVKADSDMAAPNWKNRALFKSDNLPITLGMDSGTVDLIATAPPFKMVGKIGGVIVVFSSLASTRAGLKYGRLSRPHSPTPLRRCAFAPLRQILCVGAICCLALESGRRGVYNCVHAG